MAIGTYAELKTAVGNWLERASETEVTDRVAEWIDLAEARINRELRGLRRTTVTDTSLTGTIGSRNVSISSLAFLAPVSLVLTSDSVQQVLRPYVAGTQALQTTNGYPGAWAINDQNIELDTPCDKAHTFAFRYHKTLDIAVDSTNWLLTNYPDVYLYESLKQASIYFKDPQGATGYGGIAQQAMNEVKAAELASSDGVLTVDPALLVNNMAGFNINTGAY